MPKSYRVQVSWSVTGNVQIEANSGQEAEDKAKQLNPTAVQDAVYVDESWWVVDWVEE